MTHLAKLTFKTVDRSTKRDPIIARRDKLIAGLKEQKLVHTAALNKQDHRVERHKWMTNDMGERVAVKEKVVHDAISSTLTMTSMIFATILAAGVFSLVFIGLGGEERVAGILSNMPGGATGALVFCMIFIFFLGFFLDFVEISVIVLPLVTPTLILLGHDPIWLGVLIAINLQTSFLTPPFGFSLFYLRGAAPKEVTTGHIYAGVVPFIGIQAVGVILIWMLPALATWLPSVLF